MSLKRDAESSAELFFSSFFYKNIYFLYPYIFIKGKKIFSSLASIYRIPPAFFPTHRQTEQTQSTGHWMMAPVCFDCAGWILSCSSYSLLVVVVVVSCCCYQQPPATATSSVKCTLMEGGVEDVYTKFSWAAIGGGSSSTRRLATT